MSAIREHQSDGWSHVITLSDPGYTGYTYNRPGLLQLIDAARRGMIKVVVVYKRERLFRNADLAAQVQAQFDMWGVRVYSCVEGMHDSSPHSVLMRQFIDANAQFERANTKQRILDCVRYKAKQGDWQGGTPSFGYSYVPGSKVLTVNEPEAAIVRYIFEQVAAGMPLAELAQTLKRHKLFSRYRRPSKRGRDV